MQYDFASELFEKEHLPQQKSHYFLVRRFLIVACMHMVLDFKGTEHATHSIVVKLVKIFKTEKTIEIQLVRLTQICGKV